MKSFILSLTLILTVGSAAASDSPSCSTQRYIAKTASNEALIQGSSVEELVDRWAFGPVFNIGQCSLAVGRAVTVSSNSIDLYSNSSVTTNTVTNALRALRLSLANCGCSSI